jgi:hypothetical protein
MKRLLIISLFTIVLSSSFAQPVRCQEASKVLLFIRGGSPDWEFMLSHVISHDHDPGILTRMTHLSG